MVKAPVETLAPVVASPSLAVVKVPSLADSAHFKPAGTPRAVQLSVAALPLGTVAGVAVRVTHDGMLVAGQVAFTGLPATRVLIETKRLARRPSI